MEGEEMAGGRWMMDDKKRLNYEHIFAMLSTMEKKADTPVVPHPSEAVFHLPSVFIQSPSFDIRHSQFMIRYSLFFHRPQKKPARL